MNQLKGWRANHSTWIQYWSNEQRVAASAKDFPLAKFFGECKKDSLADLKWIQNIIDQELSYSGLI